MRTLYVGGLPHETSNEGLRDLFAAFGAVADARVVVRPNTGTCRGFGYVTFSDAEAAERALAAGVEFDGHRLRIDFAR